MNKIENILNNLLAIVDFDNYTIKGGTLYLLTPNTVSISTHFDIEGNLEYAEVFNMEGEDICDTSEIRQICYAQNTITVITEDYKIILSASGCNLTLL